MPHAILIPLPAQGHINPMMQLAWKLVADGFLITFVNTEFNHRRIVQANSENKFTQDCCNKIRMISVPDGLPPEDSRKDFVTLLQALEYSMGPSVIQNLIQEINDKEEEEHKITCVIADYWFCYGLHDVAKFHQVSLAAFHASPAYICALRCSSSRLVSLGLLPSDGIPKEDKIVKYLPFMPPLHSRCVPWLYGGEYIFQLGIRIGEALRQIKWVLINSVYELEAPVVDEFSREVGTYPIGPLIPYEFMNGETTRRKIGTSFWADEVDCLQWLDKQAAQSVIYVSFGSLAVFSERQVEELALGLQATGRPFLWVFRSDLVDGTKSALPPGFLEHVGQRCCIVSWAPQASVLSHPSVACYVTHCGWNSVEESITMGVPMLCWAYFADQFINRTYIVDVWKVGLPLNANKDGILDKMEFANAVERLLVKEGVTIRNEVNKWKKIVRDAIEEGGTSYTNYCLFVDAVKNKIN
uniref:Glycosyltransferase n=1 Tax=Araucaria cunninghamii TaxID=56994 RepID=A0A0D6QRP3_ARACU